MNGIERVGGNADYGRIASGKRINSAADDASGLSIAEKLKAESNGLTAGAQNAEAGKNALNVADGAMEGITDYLQRIKELSVKASNGLNSAADLQAIQKEIDQNLMGIQDIAKNTEYNTMKLLDGSMADMDLATKPDGSGQKIQMTNATLEALGIDGYNVTGSFDMSRIDDALKKVSESRSTIGAGVNSLEHAYSYNQNAALQQTASQSRIEDLDMPKAISELKKNEVLGDYQNLMLKKKMEDESLVTKLLQ